MGNVISPYGGHNDRLLTFVQENDDLSHCFWMRAREEDNIIELFLNCNDVFQWASSDLEPFPEKYWEEFVELFEEAELHFDGDENVLHWYGAAWCVKLRDANPQQALIKRYPEFVKMLDFLDMRWK